MRSRTRKALGLVLTTGWLLGGGTLEAQQVEIHYLLGKDPGLWRRGVAADLKAGFTLSLHDRSVTLGPGLVYSTLFGDSRSEAGTGIAVDAAGNTWVAGGINPWNQPAPRPPQTRGTDAFLMKLSPQGALLSLTVIGGSDFDHASDVALDPAGNVYLTGLTRSADFPRVRPFQAPFQTDHPAYFDGFVVKLDPSGSRILYASNLGGSGDELDLAIAVDPAGRAYLAGTTSSPDFPQVRPLPLARPDAEKYGEAFITQVSRDGSTLLFSSFVGGSGEDYGAAVDVDAAGFIYLTGTIGWSPDFPLVRPLKPVVDLETGDAFVAKIDPARSAFVYSTPLGGSFIDSGSDIAVNAAGFAYVTGTTLSRDFPLRNPLQSVLNGGETASDESDVFLTRLDPQGGLVSSTYLGGIGSDFWPSIALGPSGDIHLLGATSSPDFPLRDAVDAECAPILERGLCAEDVFVTRLTPDASEIVFSTYLGGSEKPEGRYHPAQELPGDIAVSPRGDTYIAGYTYSTDFPVVNAFQTTYGGDIDAFVARITGSRPPTAPAGAPSVSPDSAAALAVTARADRFRPALSSPDAYP